MKSKILLTLLLASWTISPQIAEAGEKEWAAAGKILTGLVGISVLNDIVHTPSTSYYNCHYPRGRAYHYRRGYPYYSRPSKVWVPGHYETREKSVWVPGFRERVWVEPKYRYKGHCKILVRDGYYRYRWVPGHYETKTVNVWVPGYWSECS